MDNYNVFESSAEEALSRLLSFSVREDREEIVRKLKSRYISISGAMYADRQELSALVGEAAARMIKLAAALISRSGTDAYPMGEIYTELEIAEYLVSFFFGASEESIYLLLFSDDGALLGAELVSKGTVNASEIATRIIIEAARSYGSKRLALAHNHPRGIALPSKEDVAVTGALRQQLATVGLSLTAHYIVAARDCIRLGDGNDFSILQEE